MKIITYILFLVVMFDSCKILAPKNVHSYKYNNIADYNWTKLHNGKQYELTLKRGEGIWFTGSLTVNKIDSILIKGFVKGNTYPSQYFLASDSNKIGSLMMKYRNDSVRIDDYAKKIFDTTVYFYKVRK